ncbi:XRE family transcriptional regulator [Methylobacterium sp. 77]|uniref:XRE family transcriptional regulator n=1 Tax=Methylobacterium sp. 77 TaxID=1101192 RepID=UPI00039EA928|nr:XRE family transcriptional regulator [Methylobacterium sp. 77]
MARTMEQVMAAIPPDRLARIHARADEMKAEIDGLKALRLLADRSQEDIARELGITQPAVLKMERQTDLYLSTLRRFVEAAGGKLELRVELPGKGVICLTSMGELAP